MESIWGFIKKPRPFNHIFGGDRILRAWYRGIKNAGPHKVHSLQPHIKKNQNPILKDVEFLRDIAGSTWLSLPTSSAWYNRVYTRGISRIHGFLTEKGTLGSKNVDLATMAHPTGFLGTRWDDFVSTNVKASTLVWGPPTKFRPNFPEGHCEPIAFDSSWGHVLHMHQFSFTKSQIDGPRT